MDPDPSWNRNQKLVTFKNSYSSETNLKFFLSLIIINVTLDMDPDPNWAKIMDPDLNSMYLNTQHWWCLPESATLASPASVDRASLETSRHGKRRKKNTGLDKIIIIIIHISPTVHQEPLFNTLFV